MSSLRSGVTLGPPAKRQRLDPAIDSDLSIVVPENPENESSQAALAAVDVSSTPPTYSTKLGCEIVSIDVGPSSKQFCVHKKLLSDTAPVFDRMFNGGFKEATDNSANFPEDDPEAWELFIEWLYTSSLDSLDPLRGISIRDATHKQVKLFCLAETYGVERLMDKTIDTIANSFNCEHMTPGISIMEYVYKHTQEGSPLRTLMATWYYNVIVTRKDEKPTRYTTDALFTLAVDNPDLIFDLLLLMRGQHANVSPDVMRPTTVQACKYHQHSLRDEPECPYKQEPRLSTDALKLLEIMFETFPNGKKRFRVDSLSRRVAFSHPRGLQVAIDELVGNKKIKWVDGSMLQCL